MKKAWITALMLPLVAGCTHVDAASASYPPGPAIVDAAPPSQPSGIQRIAVATAYSPELAALLPSLQDRQVQTINGRPFYTGTISGKPVVLFETGVSLVNAAMSTQLLFDHFDVSALVVSGIAGGVDPNLAIGDVTVPAQWGQYNEMVYMRELPGGGYQSYDDGYASDTGEKFQFPAFEFMQPDGVRIVSAAEPRPERRFWFPADPALLQLAREIADDVSFTRCSSDGQCLDYDPKLVIGGNGVTGSVFQDNRRFREYLYDTFQAQVVEMETSAIAMVSYANAVPFIAFRSLSDLAGGGNAERNEEDIFEDTAAENAAKVVLEFLEQYPAEPMS